MTAAHLPPTTWRYHYRYLLAQLVPEVPDDSDRLQYLVESGDWHGRGLPTSGHVRGGVVSRAVNFSVTVRRIDPDRGELYIFLKTSKLHYLHRHHLEQHRWRPPREPSAPPLSAPSSPPRA